MYGIIGMNTGNNLILRVLRFYCDGFRNMRIGKTLWLVLLIKLFVIFFVLRLFFMPDYLKQNAPEDGEAQYVSEQLQVRMNEE